jgi:hypothetical protein
VEAGTIAAHRSLPLHGDDSHVRHLVSGQKVAIEWLTTEGLSELLGGIPVSTIRGWRLVGIGPPHVRLGGLVRYQRSAVDRWIADGGDRRDEPSRR